MNITLPQKIEFQDASETEAKIIIGPCHPGYGITLGNALKRVLMSSLEGGAIFAVKIKGVQHEFSTLPDVMEDVVEIILNLKKINFKVHTDKEVKLALEVKGEKEVKAKDIKLTSDVEITNPDAHIATLVSKKAELKMDIFVKRGIGFWPVEERDEEEKEIGKIAVDAFFGPVKKVGLKIENVRVKQMTNYENIILDIKTNGVVSPKDALKKSIDILLDQFTHLQELAGPAEKSKKESNKKEDEKKKTDKKK